MFHFVKISFGKGSSQPKGVKSEFTRGEVLVDLNEILANAIKYWQANTEWVERTGKSGK